MTERDLERTLTKRNPAMPTTITIVDENSTITYTAKIDTPDPRRLANLVDEALGCGGFVLCCRCSVYKSGSGLMEAGDSNSTCKSCHTDGIA